MVFHTSRDEIQKYWAFADRARHWAGSAVGFRRATFAGHPIVPHDRATPPFWRRDFIENKVLFSTYHLSPQNTRHYVNFLNGFCPEELLGYPSSLSLLAQMWPSDTPPRFCPKAIITSGETLFPFQKTAIEERFGCRVSDQYSAGGEMGPVISMCEAGNYHEHPESGIIEVLDQDGQPVPPGCSGEIVVTGFTNWTMPLIRYRTGDEAQLEALGLCDCRRTFRRFSRIDGKIGDRLILPDGRVLGYLYTLIKSYPNIRECHFRQIAADRITLYLVPNEQFGDADRRKIESLTTGFLGPGVRLTCEVVSAIERTKRGKFRLVVSDIEEGQLENAV
jgi:phenylacetate-CoA ligase